MAVQVIPGEDLLMEGDVLVYQPQGLFGWITAVKTWCRAAGHVEVYAGGGRSFASRPGLGVDLYPLRLDGLSRVLRPNGYLSMRKVEEWFSGVRGQGYDYIGLLCFYLAVRHGSRRRMFCSELATRLLRNGDFMPFATDWDADETAPATFLVPPPTVLSVVWSGRRFS